MPMHFDAVVVGGGPAGALTALLLAQLRWHVALVEFRPRGRIKTCGHCLNPRALRVLQRHGLFEPVAKRAAGITDRLRVHWRNGRSLESPLVDAERSTHGLLVQRSWFDQMIIDAAGAAGAVVFQPAVARPLHASAGGWSIALNQTGRTFDLRVGLVIGADGVGSRVARTAGLADKSSAGRKYGFSFDLSIGRYAAQAASAVEMFVGAAGYLGSVREHDRLHMAALVSPHNDSRDPIRFARQLATEHRALSRLGLDAITGDSMCNFAATGPMPWRPRAVADHRTALVGDAAGYVEPFSGEGMAWALESAEALAEVAASTSPGRWTRDTASTYARSWRTAVADRQRTCRVLALLLSKPRLSGWAFHFGAQWPLVSRLIVQRMVRNVVTPS